MFLSLKDHSKLTLLVRGSSNDKENGLLELWEKFCQVDFLKNYGGWENSVKNQSEWCLIHVSNKSRYSVVLELLAIFVSSDTVSPLIKWEQYNK